MPKNSRKTVEVRGRFLILRSHDCEEKIPIYKVKNGEFILNPKFNILRIGLLPPETWQVGYQPDTSSVPPENYITKLESRGHPNETCPYLNFERVYPGEDQCLVLSDAGGEVTVFYQPIFNYKIEYTIISRSNRVAEVQFLNPDYERGFAFETYDASGALVPVIRVKPGRTITGSFLRDAHNAYQIVRSPDRNVEVNLKITALDNQDPRPYSYGVVCLALKACCKIFRVPIYENVLDPITNESSRIVDPEFREINQLLRDSYYSDGFPPCFPIPPYVPPGPECGVIVPMNNIFPNNDILQNQAEITFRAQPHNIVFIAGIIKQPGVNWVNSSYSFLYDSLFSIHFGDATGLASFNVTGSILCRGLNGCAVCNGGTRLPDVKLLRWQSNGWKYITFANFELTGCDIVGNSVEYFYRLSTILSNGFYAVQYYGHATSTNYEGALTGVLNRTR